MWEKAQIKLRDYISHLARRCLRVLLVELEGVAGEMEVSEASLLR